MSELAVAHVRKILLPARRRRREPVQPCRSNIAPCARYRRDPTRRKRWHVGRRFVENTASRAASDFTRARTRSSVLRGSTSTSSFVCRLVIILHARVSLRVGTSPVASMLGASERSPLPVLLHRADRERRAHRLHLARDATDKSQRSAEIRCHGFNKRRRVGEPHGERRSISYWRGDQWSTPWLTSYAGLLIRRSVILVSRWTRQ